MSVRRVIKGWAFNKAVPSGLGNMPAIPFFRQKYMAEGSAKDWMATRGLKIVRATLTLDRVQPVKKRRR
jgi:hypothetical protein